MADETPPDDTPATGPQEVDAATEIEQFTDEPAAPAADRMPHAVWPFDELPAKPHMPLRWGELLGVLCLIVLCDVTIYRGNGFAGYALLFSAGPLLLWLSSSRRFSGLPVCILSVMLLALAGKLLWCGSSALVVIGFALVVVFSMAIAGYCPYVLEGFFYLSRTVGAGYVAIIDYGRRVNSLGPVLPRSSWISVLLPAAALLVFGWIFVLANPDLTTMFGEGIQQALDALLAWMREFSPSLLEIAFWFITLWIVAGLLRPLTDSVYTTPSSNGADSEQEPATAEAFLYAAFRNTLTTVILLFAVYLVFEFKTLWLRDFKPGFYYSGYAHEGAAWLTVALALATVVLSLVFRGSILRDPRLGLLRKLAWLWSIENMVLALAVFNRLFIYIGFNGMTRMRIVALYGMSAVVVGFVLVVWKIVHNRTFLWLVRRHLWTLAIAIYLLAMTPLDTIVVNYNVRRILAGDPAPSVQISVHPINAEGVLYLTPLLESDNEIIREGVAALLAEHERFAENQSEKRTKRGWTAYQAADTKALTGLRNQSERWKRYKNPDPRTAALKRFHEYAYQWY